MAGKKKMILVAEDEKPMAKALQLKLQHIGYDVTVANNGQEAIDFLVKGGIDLVLLDLVMPKLDGFGVLEQVKQKKIKVPIIVSTNLSQEQDEKRVRELGAKDYFVKSNTPLSDVIKHIEKILK
ncbi:response regulator [Patescibacteria group bacterium]|nr:response regulator [Patescibacteria group bacterium]MBU1721179.1 response regulator [Patescibacteria group bacterium]MBU1900891.1 response regulator [Patescibacteria group bacterium]